MQCRNVQTSEFPDLDGFLGLLGMPLSGFVGGEIQRLSRDLLGFGWENVVGCPDVLVEAAVGLLLLRERLLFKQELEQNHPECPDIHLVGVLPSPRRIDSVLS